MSYLPKISSYNSDQVKSTMGLQVSTPISRSQTLNATQPSPNVSYTQQTPQRGENGGTKKPKNNLPKIQGGTPQFYSPAVFESRLNELESKITLLQETNSILVNRLNDSERKTDLQIQDLLMKSNDEKTNRTKSEKMIGIISDQHNLANKDLNLKINILQETLEKDGSYQNQQRERDIENYKNIISKLTDKVSEIVKKEIEERFRADLDNRENNIQVKNYLENELGFIKSDLEKFIAQNQTDLQKISLECSERTHNVSKYIDQQIQEHFYGKGSENELLKNFVSKLTDQVKFNLITQNNKNISYEENMAKLEKMIKAESEYVEKKMTNVENRLLAKISSLKSYTEMNLTKMNKDFYIELMDLSKNVDKNINFLTTQLIDTRKKAADNFEVILKDNREKFKAVIDDMRSISQRIYQYEELIKSFDAENTLIKDKLNKDICNIVSRVSVALANERMLQEVQNNCFEEELKRTNEIIIEKEKALKEEIDKNYKETQETFNDVYSKLKDANDKIDRHEEINEKRFELTKEEMGKITVKNILNEMIQKAESEEVNKKLNELTKITNIHDSEIEGIYENMGAMQDDINDNKSKIVGILSNIDDLQTNLNKETAKLNELNLTFREYEKETTIKNMIDQAANLAEMENTRRLVIVGCASVNEKLEVLNKDLKKTKSGTESLRSSFEKALNSMEVNTLLDKVMLNVEIDNIYKQLKKIEDVDFKKIMEKTGENASMQNDQMVENKIAAALEKIKKENNTMWEDFANLEQKYFQPEEIKKIIGEVPPVILPKNETLQNILELSYEDYNYPVPFDAALVSKLINANRLDKEGGLQNANPPPQNEMNEEPPAEEDGASSKKKSKASSKKSKGTGGKKKAQPSENPEDEV
ncbi:MAG: hypothetical protein MJ252_16275 [archaeon]|nr:hypothetical protein [archaeon]